MGCLFDTGEYCEYLSEDLRPDAGLYQPCVVPSHQSFCICYQEAEQKTEPEEQEPLKLLDDDGQEVE